MQLFNTLSGRKELFVPLNPERVTLYVCGPTVYSYAHIGNARPAVVFDVLARVLRLKYAVHYARNITDIDDKINAKAAEEGVEIGVITSRYTAIYREDMAALGVLPPDFEPKVTEHLPQIIGFIERLITAGHAYSAEGHVLFDVPSFPDYGRLSKRDRREMLAGARVEVAPYKKDPGDFVLWKPSSADQPGWESPWGRGRPGWHIECSAMSEAVLGDTLDIHGGGHDLIFPHHENEIAQSVCAHGGAPYARYWLHNGFLNFVNSQGEAEKMSKSLGNVKLVHDLVQLAPAEALRLLLLSAHYRQPLEWSEAAVQESRKRLDGFYEALRPVASLTAPEAAVPAGVLAALEDDLNTPLALAELSVLAKTLNKAEGEAAQIHAKAQLLAAGKVLGLLQQAPQAWFAGSGGGKAIAEAEIEAQLAARLLARQTKQWAESDRIRDALKAQGVLVEDGKDGQRWKWL